MEYQIKGGGFPVVEFTLNKGETITTEAGGMAWMSDHLTMDTGSQGGIGGFIGRAFTGEMGFQNKYTAEIDGAKITVGVGVPGSIAAIQITNGQSLICQKTAFLASFGAVEMSVHFNQKIGVGLFGGEGFIMQKFTGNGVVFLEIDGSKEEFNLAAGEKLYLSSGYLVSMDSSCTLNVETVKGLKNKFLGGEGWFNTVVTGPGRVVAQTLPITKLAYNVDPYITHPESKN